jgi:hypothetical protein
MRDWKAVREEQRADVEHGTEARESAVHDGLWPSDHRAAIATFVMEVKN